jgi:hypothetical protein
LLQGNGKSKSCIQVKPKLQLLYLPCPLAPIGHTYLDLVLSIK